MNLELFEVDDGGFGEMILSEETNVSFSGDVDDVSDLLDEIELLIKNKYPSIRMEEL